MNALLFLYDAARSDSKAYISFLDILGKRVKLKGYTGFKGGLDTSGRGCSL